MRTHTDRDLRLLVARSSVGARHAPLDLAGAQLEMANLPHADLRGANLARVNLRGAMLWGALLDGACLEGADLTCANLTWSSLEQCNLRGALLVEADLDEARVDGGWSSAVTAGADLVTITLVGSAWTQLLKEAEGATETEESMRARKDAEEALLAAHRQSAPLSLRKRGAAGFALCRLDSGFAGDWYGYKREQIELAQTRVLSDGDLEDLLRWSATTDTPLNLRGCNLSGAYLRNAALRNACLNFANLTGADIRGADLTGADLRDSYGWADGRDPR